MRKIILAAFLILAPVAAFAQFPAAGTAPAATGTGGGAAGATPTQGMYPQVGAPMPIVVDQRPPADTSFSIGTGIADLLGTLAAIFGSVIGGFAVKWIKAVAARAGVQVSQDMSDKLDAIIENGVHAGAAKLGQDLTGKLSVTVKNEVAAEAVKYAQAHGVETIKSLTGVDPNDPKVVEALQARAAKALNTIGPDAVLSPTADKPAAVATASITTDAPVAEAEQKPAGQV